MVEVILVRRQTEFASAGGVRERDIRIVSETDDRTVAPVLRRRRLGGDFDLIRRAECDVDAPAIGLPPRNPRRKMFIGVGNPSIVFFFEFVFYCSGRGIPAKPELFDELRAFVISSESSEGIAFLVGRDVGDISVEPCAPRRRRLRKLRRQKRIVLQSFARVARHGDDRADRRRRGGWQIHDWRR